MGYEVDFIGVGQESSSGDAIAIRWGNLHGPRREQRVVIIDGGFQQSGEHLVVSHILICVHYGQPFGNSPRMTPRIYTRKSKRDRPLVQHVRDYYQTDSVDAVISTHPDQDHVSGLHVVLDELSARQLWIHKPWVHNQGLADKFEDGRVTDSSLEKRLRESLDTACSLVAKAEEKHIRVVEPFACLSLDNDEQLCVLGPTQRFYESLIPQFDGMPKPKARVIIDMLEEVAGTTRKAAKRIFSTWGKDELDDDDTTSAKNNTSVITALNVEGDLLLFTGDAGVTALTCAADRLESHFPGTGIRFMQIPHHGSRRNIGPTILNHMIGCLVPEGQTRDITAIASTAKNGEPKHPRKSVMNAFTHRGVKALATRGRTICHSRNGIQRSGWSQARPDGYHWEYDEE